MRFFCSCRNAYRNGNGEVVPFLEFEQLLEIISPCAGKSIVRHSKDNGSQSYGMGCKGNGLNGNAGIAAGPF